VTALNMLRLDAHCDEICFFSSLIFVRELFQEIDIAALPLVLKSSPVEKFRECRLTYVGESELGKKRSKKPAQNYKIEVSTTYNGRSNISM